VTHWFCRPTRFPRTFPSEVSLYRCTWAVFHEMRNSFATVSVVTGQSCFERNCTIRSSRVANYGMPLQYLLMMFPMARLK
jgi:hypothetical protein